MNPVSDKAAVVLVSGGLDSTTVLAAASREGFRVHALTVWYGQRHEQELVAARDVAASWRVAAHKVVELDLRTFGGSALTDDAVAVPKDAHVGSRSGIPATYVPARNTILLSLALAWAEVIPAADIFIGVNALDYSGYPDCRPEFIAAFENVARLGTRTGSEGAQITVHAPLIDMTKREIIQLGLRLGVDYAQTLSCYDPAATGEACGRCDACQLRLRGFAEAGVTDPARYATAEGAAR